MSTTRLTEAAVRPLATLDPEGLVDDLEWLDEVVGDARVVAIGESAHYNAENFQFHHRLLRYLVERHGFSAYARESGFTEGWLVDDWVRGGAGDRGQVMAAGVTSLMGLWTELGDKLEWLRRHNADATHPVGFYGIDAGGSNASLLPSLDAVIAYLAQADPDYAVDPSIRETAAVWAAPHAFAIPQAIGAYIGLSQDRKDALTAGLTALVLRVSARRLEYVRRTGADAYERASRSLTHAVTLDSLARSMAGGDVQSVLYNRDVVIADTVEWILRREERIVLVAHNGHIHRWSVPLPGAAPAAPMGLHLADRLSDAYVVIGSTAGTGETLTTSAEDFAAGKIFMELEPPRAGSLDALMQASHDQPFGVNLRTLSPADTAAISAASTQRFASEYPSIDPVQAYDAIIHLPHLTAATLDSAALGHSPEEIQKLLG